MKLSAIPFIAAVALSASFAAPAMATVPLVSTPVTLLNTDIGDSFTFNYNGFIDEISQAGLSARSTFRLSSVSGDNKTWTFTIDELANTSGAPLTNSRVSAFAFNVDPNGTGGAATGMFNVVGTTATVPQFGTTFDICFRAGGGGGGCAGGGGGGVSMGDPAYSGGTFSLTFANAINALELDNFVVRYQSIEGSNLGTSGVGTVTAVPEPASWAMLIVGFGLAGAAMRRRRALLTA